METMELYRYIIGLRAVDWRIDSLNVLDGWIREQIMKYMGPITLEMRLSSVRLAVDIWISQYGRSRNCP